VTLIIDDAIEPNKELLSFLNQSTAYDPELCLNQLPLTMIQERIVCLGRLQRHEEAIRLMFDQSFQDSAIYQYFYSQTDSIDTVSHILKTMSF
jgi:hypothetical protein